MQIKASLRGKMGLNIVIFSLCICISVLLISTPSAARQIQEQPSHQQDIMSMQAANGKVKSSDHHTLPRKLSRLLEEVQIKGLPGQGSSSYNKQKPDTSRGKVYDKEENAVGGSRPGAGTWREWVEGTDTSQFFTMDYTHVRSRRPVHNKSLPVAP